MSRKVKDEQPTKAIKSIPYFIVSILTILVVRGTINYIVPEMMKPKYDSSILNRTINDKHFSVRLSQNSTLDTENLAAINNQLSTHGVSVSGTMYKDKLLEGRINILTGCAKYSFDGDDENYIASTTAVQGALDEAKRQNEARGFLVEETSRNYSQDGDAYTGVADTTTAKDGDKIFTRQRVSMKGNDICMLIVTTSDSDWLPRVYDDVNESFVYKW